MLCRLFWILTLVPFFAIPVFSQNKRDVPTPSFYKIIQDDSVMMFFDQDFKFTNRACAQYTRYVKVDDSGHFNSYFEDVDRANKVLGRGRYAHGLKYGYFQTYYANGNLKVKGAYREHVPEGEWNYFYENGLPERTLLFTGTDTLLIHFVDTDGNVTINDGNGEFKGRVAGSPGSLKNQVEASGMIVNGKPHGEWTSIYDNKTYCVEQFDNGKFISGIFPNAIAGQNYNSRSFLNAFVLNDYLDVLDAFKMKLCSPLKAIDTKTDSLGIDYAKFIQVFEPELDLFMQRGMVADEVVSVRFSVDESGTPGDFSLISSRGRYQLKGIIKALKAYGTYNPLYKSITFNLRLTSSDDRIRFWFSIPTG